MPRADQKMAGNANVRTVLGEHWGEILFATESKESWTNFQLSSFSIVLLIFLFHSL